VRACLAAGHGAGSIASLLVDELAALRTPTLILQGEVEGYTLSLQVQLHWITSGDHSF
jgi:predicted alpha/beta-hydrolase family hydrolase